MRSHVDNKYDNSYIVSMIAGEQKNETDHHFGAYPVNVLQQFNAGLIDEVNQSDERDDKADKERKKLFCKTCLNLITLDSYGIEVDGSHSHTFMNPRGIVFNIGCFMNAQGCFTMGNPTAEFTWFSGYSWSHVICANCVNHLGWYYQSGSSSFYGLILDQLMKE